MGAKRSVRRVDDGSENEDPVEEEAEDEEFLDDEDEEFLDDEDGDDVEDEEDVDDDEWDDADLDEEAEEDESETLCGYCQRPLGLHYADEAEEGLIPDSVQCEQCRVYFCSEGCLEQHRDAEHATEQGD
jgi:hypothetical protein